MKHLPPAKSRPRSSSLLIFPMSMSNVSVSQSWATIELYNHQILVYIISGLGIKPIILVIKRQSRTPANQCQWQSPCCGSARRIFEASECERLSQHTRFSRAAPCSPCSPGQVYPHYAQIMIWQPLSNRGVRHTDKPYRLSIYRHFLKILISIWPFLEISISYR